MREEKEAGLPPQFLKILEQMTVSPAELQTELTVPASSVVTLSAHPRHASYRRPKMLQTSDLDQLKRWIGLPDQVVKGRCLLDREERAALADLRKAAGKAAAEERAAQAVGGTRLDALRAHARAYLYGDSSLVAEAKPLIQRHFELFLLPVWLFRKVKVCSGAVLLFGPGANILLASELEIEQGGQVVSLGSLTIRVGTLRKTTPTLVATPIHLKHVLKLLRA